MTNHNDPHARPPLAADDPRISEWIDGRLSAAEAADLERAVRESPALTRLVADLRALKEAARLVPVVTPPEGFADRVLGAVVSGGGAAPRAAEVRGCPPRDEDGGTRPTRTAPHAACALRAGCTGPGSGVGGGSVARSCCSVMAALSQTTPLEPNPMSGSTWMASSGNGNERASQ
jgi:anti-sigma factor RsiW